MINYRGINIHSNDPAESFEFYKGLGFPVKEEAEDGSEWYGAVLEIGGSDLWIWRDRSRGEENTGRMTVEIVLSCEDIDKTYAELKSKGYSVTEPELMFYGVREMRLTDPDGNRILLLD